LTESQNNIQSSLTQLTVYNWQVIAKNSSGESPGPQWTFTTKDVLIGDINDSGNIDLTDVIMAIQIASGLEPTQVVYEAADINDDGMIGLEEAINALQIVSGVRSEEE